MYISLIRVDFFIGSRAYEVPIWCKMQQKFLLEINLVSIPLLLVVILFPTEYKQWRTEYMSNIITNRKP